MITKALVGLSLYVGFAQSGFNLTALPCNALREFLTYHSGNVVESMKNHPARPLLLSLLHLIGTVADLKSDCVTESFRFISMVAVRDSLPILKDGDFATERHSVGEDTNSSKMAMAAVVERFHENIQRLPVNEPVVPYYSHEDDGRLTTLEAMRVRTFKEQPLSNLCLMQFALAELFAVGELVLDIGAGPSAADSVWFNKTGIVTSYAMDRFPDASFVTDGQVVEVDYFNETALWEYMSNLTETVDWLWLHNSTQRTGAWPWLSVVKPRRGIIAPLGVNVPEPNQPLTTSARNVCNDSSIIILSS